MYERNQTAVRWFTAPFIAVIATFALASPAEAQVGGVSPLPDWLSELLDRVEARATAEARAHAKLMEALKTDGIDAPSAAQRDKRIRYWRSIAKLYSREAANVRDYRKRNDAEIRRMRDGIESFYNAERCLELHASAAQGQLRSARAMSELHEDGHRMMIQPKP